MGYDGTEPQDGRKIVWANDDGLLYEFDILSFVVLQTSRALVGDQTSDEVDIDDLTTRVAESMGDMAMALVIDGWFTKDEYLGAFAAVAAQDLDDDIKGLLG